MYSRKFTPERIITLAPNEVFVFGSNLKGLHGGGAARIARKQFGAVWGQGKGLQGQSYAIPTMQGGVETIKPYVDEFIEFAKEHQNLVFYVTRIGCGIAGFKDAQVAPLFTAALDVENVILPESFVRILEPDAKMPKAVRDMLYGQTRTLVDILKEMNKREPITDSWQAMSHLRDFLRLNPKSSSEGAVLAQRTIWCILSKYMQEELPFDLDRLDKDIYEFHDGHNLWVDSVVKVYYRYCVAKIIRFISFLDTFRRYKNFEDVRSDIRILDITRNDEDCSESFFRFSDVIECRFTDKLRENEDEIFSEGKLDVKAMEQVFFKNHQALIDSLGLERMIEEKYRRDWCHIDVYTPIGKLAGPDYRKNTEGKFEATCSPVGLFLGLTSFEMSKAKELLDSDVRYRSFSHGYGLVYIPVGDLSLPVFSEREGIMQFEDDNAKRRFIELFM